MYRRLCLVVLAALLVAVSVPPAAWADSHYRIRARWGPMKYVPVGAEAQIRAALIPAQVDAQLVVYHRGERLGMVDPRCGCLGWVPSTAGKHELEIRAVSRAGEELARAVLTVAVMDYQVSLWTPRRQVQMGQPLALKVVALPAHEVHRLQVFQVTETGLVPVGPEAEKASAAVTWTPPEPGRYTLVARASDASGRELAVSESLVIVVQGDEEWAAEPEAPEGRYQLATSLSDHQIAVGQGVSVWARVAPAAGIGSLWMQMPDGTRHQILAAEGQIEWTPLQAGPQQIAIWAVDAAGRVVVRSTESVFVAHREVLAWGVPDTVSVGDRVRVFGWARPEASMKEIEVYQVDENGPDELIGIIGGSRGYAEWTAPAPGTHRFVLRARDLWDNPVASSDEVAITVTPRQRPPENPAPDPPADEPSPPVPAPPDENEAVDITVEVDPNPVPLGSAVHIGAAATPADTVARLVLEALGDDGRWQRVQSAAGADRRFVWQPERRGISVLMVRALDGDGRIQASQLVPVVADRYTLQGSLESDTAAPGEAVVIPVRATPAAGVNQIALFVRAVGEAEWPDTPVAVEPGNRGTLRWIPNDGGLYTLRVVALDAAGRSLVERQYEMSVHQVQVDANRFRVPVGTPVALSVSAAPAETVDRIAVYRRDSQGRLEPVGRPVAGPEGEVHWIPEEAGEYPLEVRALDQSGRILAVVNTEVTAYAVAAAASRDQVVAGETFTVRAEALPATADYLSIWWQTDWGSWRPLLDVRPIRGGTGTFTLSLPDPGNWTLEVRATDRSGGLLARSENIEVTVSAQHPEAP